MTAITREEAAKAYANGEDVEVTYAWLDDGDWRDVFGYTVFDESKATFRRKPKPLECFVIVSHDGCMGCAWETLEQAEESLGGLSGLRIVHFREVMP